MIIADSNGRASTGRLVWLAILLALAVRLPTLGILPLWLDEITTVKSLGLDSGDLIEHRLARMHSPLYFLFLQALGLEHAGPFWLRLPAALFDSLAAGVLTLVAARHFGWRAGLAMAGLYAVAPILVQQAQEARPYGALYLAEAVLIACAARLLRHPTLALVSLRRRTDGTGRRAARLRVAWCGALLAGTLAVALMPLGLFVCLAVDLAVLVQAALRRRWRRFAAVWMLQRLLSLLLLLPLFIGWSAYVGTVAKDYWPPDPTLPVIIKVIGVSHAAGLANDAEEYLGRGGEGVLAALFLLMALTGLLTRFRGRGATTTRVATAVALAIPACLLAISFAGTSLMVDRYASAGMAGMLLLVTAGIAAAWRWRHVAGAAVAAPLLLLMALQSGDALQPLFKPRLDKVVAVLRSSDERPVPIAVGPYLFDVTLRYALAGDPPLRQLWVDEARQHLEDGGTLWVVLRSPYNIKAMRFPELDSAYAGCREQMRGIRISIHARDPADLPAICETLAETLPLPE